MIDEIPLKKWLQKIWQVIRANSNSIWSKVIRRPEKVRWLTWEITNACNSRCLLCDIWKTPRTEANLTLKEIKKTFSDPLFKNLECILLTGGEPVLRPDLAEIILFIHDKIPGIRFTLSTNAILPDRVLEVVNKALDHGVSIDVGTSLDGIGEHHDRIRGVPGNFEKVDYLIKELLKLREKHADKLSIVAGLTLHPLTVDYVQEVQEYAREKGVQFIAQLYDEAPYYHNVGKSAAAENLDHDTRKMIQEVDRLRPSIHNLIVRKILKEKIIRFKCYAMRSFFILRANGDVMPCLRMSNVKVGNVREESPSRIWQSAKAQETRKLVRQCLGCGNTWATNWSLYNNVIPFLSMIGKFIVKRLNFR
jgi:MoaA/NifB/PqqE/SkfB family radical SAM enzyme